MSIDLTPAGSLVCFAISEDLRGQMLYVGAVLAVILGCVLAAWLLARRRRRRRKKQLHRWQEKPEPRPHHANGHQHKSPKERPQNPTLADTGGLPPRKGEGGENTVADDGKHPA